MKRIRGFTLIELAIVLVIITILIGGLAMPLSAQIQARRIAETKKTLEEARDAIIGYAMSNTVNVSPPTICTCVYKADKTLNKPDIPLDESDDPDSTCPVSLCPPSYIASATMTLTPPITRHYLPCPDLNGTDPELDLDNDSVDGLSDINNGVEDRYENTPNKIGDCAADSGNLPWVTLGTGSQDAWGNRLRYAVAEKFANKLTGMPGTGGGDLKVCSTSGCTTADVADDVVAVLVSHGPNGWGARSIHNKMLKNPISSDEKENTSTSNNFVSRSPYKPADGSAAEQAKEFDDLVVWISAPQLRGRICPAGGCP